MFEFNDMRSTILYLADLVPLASKGVIAEILSEYKNKNLNFRNVPDYVKLIPSELSRFEIVRNNNIFDLDHQFDHKDALLKSQRLLLSSFHTLSDVEKYTSTLKIESCEKLYSEICNEYESTSTFSRRIKSASSIFNNILSRKYNTLQDYFGMRLVPNDYSSFAEISKDFEKRFGYKAFLKVNLLPLSYESISNIINEDNKFYRAIHYYFNLGGEVFFECQLRPKATDQWSKLSHDTIYKKFIPITNHQKRHLELFGSIANSVDFNGILSK
jgi:ppGpp synthetase/RelA/SpoT-type nucleotidyltranferase